MGSAVCIFVKHLVSLIGKAAIFVSCSFEANTRFQLLTKRQIAAFSFLIMVIAILIGWLIINVLVLCLFKAAKNGDEIVKSENEDT